VIAVSHDRLFFWRGYYDAMSYLDDEEAGVLFRAICAYAFDGEEPDFDGNRLMQVAWTMVADNAAESVDMGRRSSEAGKRGGGRPQKQTAKKGVKKGVKKDPENPLENPQENVRYGNTSSPTAKRGSNGANAPAPSGAALAPIEDSLTLDIPPKPEEA
jgi:hypothetical protein